VARSKDIVMAPAAPRARPSRAQTIDVPDGPSGYEAAVRGAELAVWNWRLDGNRLYLSPYYWSLMGYAATDQSDDLDAVLGHVVEEDRPAVVAELQRGILGEAVLIDFRARRKDGAVRWLRSRGAAYADAFGETIGVAGALFDVTAERESDEAIRRAAERFALVFDRAPCAISIVTYGEGRYVAVNPAFVALAGVAREHIIGRTTVELGHMSDADRERLYGTLHPGSPPITFEREFRRADSTVVHAQVAVSEIDLEGRSHLLSMISDVTEQRRAQAELRRRQARIEAIFDVAPNGILIARVADGRIVEANRAGVEMLGLARDAVIGRTVVDVGVWSSLAARNAACAPVLEGRRSCSFVRRFERPDGRTAVHDIAVGMMEFDGAPCFFSIHQDLSEREETAARLLASEARFEQLFASSPVGMSVEEVSGDHPLIEVNAAWLALLGYERDEVIGRSPSELRVTVEDGLPRRAAHDAISGGRVHRRDFRARRKDGSEFEAQVSLQPLELDGRPVVVASLVDVSAEREAVGALRRREALLAQTGAVARIGGWELDGAGTLEWTEQMFRLHELPPGPAPTVREALAFYEPAQAKRVAAAVQRAIAEGVPFDLEGPFVTASGTPRVMRTQGVAARSGEAVRIYGTLQDVTEARAAAERERESHERFRKIFDSSPIPVVLSELDDGRLIDVNDAWLRDFGFTREQAIGRTTVELGFFASDEDRRLVLAPIGADERVDALEIRYTLHNGEPATYLISCERVEERGRAALLTTMSNITARKRAEEAIARANDMLESRVKDRTAQLEAALAELESFSYSVSHDLRAPLRGIVGFTEILVQEYGTHLAPEARRLLGRVAASGKRMSELIDALLELSRVARRAPTLTDVDLSRLARTILDELREGTPERPASIDVTPGLHARADAGLMRIVLGNLLGNAWKYSSHKPHTHIAFGAEERDGEQVFFVRDQGDGFDMRYADRLFGAFQRLHGTEFEGSGVGLATVKRIVERHGGHVSAEGEPGAGATFRFTLGRGH
jgi:PAS domain S-box-containing protein